MASNPDPGSRLWRGMRALIFGDEADTSLRNQIEEAIDEADESPPEPGDLSPMERQMLRNLLHFGDRTAGEIAVTRGDILAAPATLSFEQLETAFVDAGHSRLPVYGESLDDILGMIHVKDVYRARLDERQVGDIRELMRTPLFVPESMGMLDLLARMRNERVHLAIVVDEFGGTEGLVTIEDVVEEIVGDIEDEHDEENEHKLLPLGDDMWEAEARVELDELAETVDPRLCSDEVDTLGGLAFLLAGRILAPGESVEHDSGWRIEVVESDDRRMTRLRLHPPEPAEA